MSDHISRADLARKAVKMHGFGEAKYVSLRNIMAAPAANVAPANRWISVEERLPDKASECNQFYVTDTVYALRNGIRYVGYFKIWKFDGCTEFWGVPVDEVQYGDAYIDNFLREDMSHWMPLPEPPEV